MCTFITLAVACDDVAGLNEILSQFDDRCGSRRVAQVTMLELDHVLAPGEVTYGFTNRMCDCGTFLGSHGSDGPVQDHNADKEAEKYRRKGWSEGKIARALADMHDAQARRKRHVPTEDAAYWIDILTAIAQGSKTASIGVMHHFEARKPVPEDFSPRRIAAGRIDRAADILAAMPAGMFHDFDVTLERA